MVILLILDMVMKALAAWDRRAVNAIQIMDETKHSGISFFDARPDKNFSVQNAG
jgi:hypothetical protein